ncbi:MAG: response regulator [Bacteroidota bacterium]
MKKQGLFQHIKIRALLSWGFGILLTIVTFIGFNSVRQSNLIWKDTSDLFNHPFKVNIAVREIQRDVISMHRSLKDAILSENDFELNKYVAKIEANKIAVQKNFDLVYSLYLGNKTTVDSAYEAFNNWDMVRDSTLLLRRQGKIEEAAYRTTHSAELYERDMMSRIKRLEDFAMAKAKSFYAAAEVKKNSQLTQILTIIGILTLLIIVFFILIIRSISIPLKEITGVAEQQQRGDFSARSKIVSNNEMGQFAQSFNRMAESIEHELNIQSDAAEVGYVFLDNTDLMSAAQNLVSLLLVKTNSNLGVIYFLDEASGMFEPLFSAGMSGAKVHSFSGTNFEGEFGRVLLEKKRVHIKDIPDDTIFEFVTVAGTFRPKEILNIPITQKEKVLAIISLASVYNYTTKMLDLLTISEKNISIGINKAIILDKIREYSQALDNQNSLLENQSKELKLQTEELHEQNAELEMQKRQINEASRLKSEFLSNMSHELRTPLNSVIALSGVLNKRLEKRIPEEEYSYLEIIERNGKLLLHLINDILDLSRIESGKVEYRYNSFSIKDLANSIIEQLQTAADEKGILLLNKIPDDLPLLKSDVSKCHHILQNLLDNAVKFTDKGSVEIIAAVVKDHVHIIIKDTGIGIPAENLSQIFDEFLQVDGSSSRKHKGTGLGLAIAKKYCLLLDGQIDVVSAVGKGSLFTVILPLEPSEKRAEEAGDFMNSIERPSLMQPLLIRDANAPLKTLLIVEDNEAAIVQLTEILEQQGFHIQVARNGLEALEFVNFKIPDAIILDLMMPEMDGFEVLENIRGTVKTAKIPVVILTSKYLSNEELKKLSQNNVHQLIQKGDVSKSELLVIVQSIFGEKAAPEKSQKRTKHIDIKKGKASILVIEDNADNVMTVKAIIGENHFVTVAEDGADGIKKAKNNPPDLILLDISLPGMDGYAVLDELKKDSSLTQIPIIALTARVMKGDREHILNYGFDDYISKPVDLDEFENTLKKYIE